MIVYYLDYIPRRGKFGSGGWSKQAKRRPAPTVVKYVGPIEPVIKWKSRKESLAPVRFGGLTKRKVVMFDDSQVPPRLIRADYVPSWLRTLGAELPPIYTNMNWHIVQANGNLVMQGPDK